MSSILFRGFSFRFARSASAKQVSNCSRRYLSSFRDRKRFYDKVDVVETKNGYQITLDNKAVKTPHGRQLCVPYQPLAAALSVEWDSQEEFIKPEFMHLTALTNTVIDDPLGKTIESRIHDILEYLLTDTVCFLSEEPEELLAVQENEWGPLWKWFNDRYQVSLIPTNSLLVEISPELRNTMQEYVSSFNNWSLTGFEYAVESGKSLVIACALAEKEISVERAASLSRLEVEFQIKKWGSVEWAHEVDLMDLRSRLAAATLFLHLTSGSTLDGYKE